MAYYTCIVNNAGPAADGAETTDPVVYINLTDTSNPPAFVGQWFYAAEGAQNQMLAVALSAINGNRKVSAATAPPDAANPAYPAISRLYIAAT